MEENIDQQKLEKFTYRHHFDFISREIGDIRAFIISTDEFLNDNLIKHKSLKTQTEKNMRFQEGIQFESIFPDILWRTTFLHSYFRLESSLDQICKNLQQTHSHKIAISDIAGNGIFRASIYLKKVFAIEKPFSGHAWGKLNDYNRLRNIFVHGEPVVERKKAIELAKRNEGLLVAIVDIDKIALRFSKEFNLKVLETIDSFFKFLKIEMNSLNENQSNE